ncbi:MAG: tetratricopeptide repeat protein [Verrucomicrobiota bacterium]
MATAVWQGEAPAQQPAFSPAQFDPGDVFLKGYLAVKEAEIAEQEGRYEEALEKLNRASEMFGTIRKFYPDWKADMVRGRSEMTTESIGKVGPKVAEQRKKDRTAVAELEGGLKKPGTVDPARGAVPLHAPGVLHEDPLKARRLAEAQAEVRRLQSEVKRLADIPKRSGEDDRNASRVEDIRRQLDALNAELQAARQNVESLRARLAAAPMQNEMKSLNQRIDTLEQERAAMSMALEQSRGAHTKAIAKMATLEADLKVMRQKHSDMNRDLKTERNVANSVVSGQRRQLDALEKQLSAKDSELAAAQQTIKGLTGELEQSRAAFNELRDERDGLLGERDQMATLLKLNEAGRIQDLIDQNMGLAKDLREANEKVERLHRESNADKDAITDALRDLAIAKSQINGLRQERIDQDKRLAELEARLKSEEAKLAEAPENANPVEVETLREIIKRQLRVQERRRQARDLLVDAARDLGAKDERLARAIELFDGQEIALTPEESKAIDGRQVDAEFVSPFARDRATVNRATDELKRDIALFERTAEKSYLAGRYLPTRELYEMILEQHPGHVPALCRLGVVQMKLSDASAAALAFRKAVELEGANTYARRMLGYAMMMTGDQSGAEKELRRTVADEPNDAKAHQLLASLCYESGRTGEAESYFKAAIGADPLPSDPYYNLAVIYSRTERMESAREYYHKALERGALPDPKLEGIISENTTSVE